MKQDEKKQMTDNNLENILNEARNFEIRFRDSRIKMHHYIK